MKRAFAFIILCGPHALLADGSVQGTLTVEAMKPAPSRPGYVAPQTKKPVQKPEIAPAIVYLERDDEKYPRTRAGEKVRIRQEGYQFRPAMVAIQTGAKVEFPNLDDEFHNVFSYSKAKRFDLGRFRKDEASPEVLFDKAGVVKIYCEIHQHMRCFVVVLDTPWFATTDGAGKFVLKNVPPGEYWLRVFQPSEKLLQERVTVSEGKTTTVNFSR
ncbi:MAG: carboxypeptidase regulatory-like domain-containing protein [Prosthecobacter sp.]